MRWVLLGYMFLFVHRPFEFFPSLAGMYVERVYAAFAIVAVFLSPGKHWPSNRQHLAYLAFAAAVLFCWLVSPWSAAGQPVVEDWFKVVVFYVLLVAATRTEKDLRFMVLGFLGVMAVYMLHSLREYVNGRHVYRMGIPRLIGVDVTQGDPNSFGASIVIALPFLVVFWQTARNKMMRVLMAGYLGLSVLCVLLTGSRSSLVGLAVWSLVMVLRSKYRKRLVPVLVLAAPLAFVALPGSLQERFETIVNPNAGPESARASGNGRVEGLLIGGQLFVDNLMTGIGPGAWRPATKRDIEAHSLPGQLAGELGLPGVVTFSAILWCFWGNIRRSRRLAAASDDPRDDFLGKLAGAVGFGVVLMLFMGLFGHNLFRHNWLWYGAFVILARHALERRHRQRQRLEWYESTVTSHDGWRQAHPAAAPAQG